MRSSPLIAIVGRDPATRLAAAAAFDDAPREWRVIADEGRAAAADVVVATSDVDWPGALRFNPLKPEELLPAVRARLADGGQARLYVVTAARAGVGVTSVALELAARGGVVGRSCLVDLDPGGSVALRLSLAGAARPHPPFGTGDPPVTVPLEGGARLLSLSDPDNPPTAAIETVAAQFDSLVIDAGAAPPGELAAAARALVVILAPTSSYALPTRRLLNELGERPVALVANRTGWGGELPRVEIERLVGRRLTLELPFSAAVRDAERDGRCCPPRWSRWSRSVGRLHRGLETL